MDMRGALIGAEVSVVITGRRVGVRGVVVGVLRQNGHVRPFVGVIVRDRKLANAVRIAGRMGVWRRHRHGAELHHGECQNRT